MYELFTCMCVYASCVCGTSGGQNWVSDPLESELDSCQLPCVCWEANLCPLQENALNGGAVSPVLLVCSWILLKVLASLFIREVGL